MAEELGLVDNLIFEAYKEKPINSMAKFRNEIRLNYGIIPSSDLYRKIINYQIEKYGKQLDVELGREYQQNFAIYSKRKREKNKKNNELAYNVNRMLERIENEKRR